MRRRLSRFGKLMMQHRYGFTLFVYLSAAAVTGVGCVLFMWAFERVLDHRLDFGSVGPWCWVTTPVLFLLAVELIRRVAPFADGAGIPQTIFVGKHLADGSRPRLVQMVSPTTMAVKVMALLLGVWAGASTGREGPTVHVAACIFFSLVLLVRRFTGIRFDMRSAVVAGGAAGLAAAFNTPLAGVTFAIEELSTDYFSSMKDYVLMAIVVAGIAAKSLTGEYAYFGHLDAPPSVTLGVVLAIGLAGGGLGATFSTALLEGKRYLSRFTGPWARYGIPIVFSWAVLAVAAVAGLRVLGPGNRAAQVLVEGGYPDWVVGFPWAKMATTLFTYWSGLAGGIFAPCLSVGSALGASMGHALNASVACCAILGMAAFLSGTIQAPMTAFVIIFEMTNQHQMLLPVMLVSLIAFMVARIAGAKHLYQALAEYYRHALTPEPTNERAVASVS